MGIFLHILRIGTTHVGSMTGSASPAVNIVNHGNIINNCCAVDIRHIIIVDINAGYTFTGHKIPIISRGSVTSPDADVDSGSYWRPAIIMVIFPPGHPCGSPLIAGSPHPSIRIVVKPVAIMKRRPAPIVIGNPGPAILRVNPISAAAIGPETMTDRSRNPHISVFRVTHPGPIRT
jgi:hypothetical protein